MVSLEPFPSDSVGLREGLVVKKFHHQCHYKQCGSLAKCLKHMQRTKLPMNNNKTLSITTVDKNTQMEAMGLNNLNLNAIIWGVFVSLQVI